MKTFFSLCEELYSSLTWMPRMEEAYEGTVTEANDTGPLPDGMAQRAVILRAAGWPPSSDEWDKAKAARETTEKIHFKS
jgi:hypothetical protein